MAKNTSFPPIKDGVKADNTTYSSNKIEEIVSTVESEIPVLPEPAVGDINKVIGITSDGSTGAEYGLITIENELPAPSSSNAGKIAKVVSDGEGGYEWSAEDESTELPAPEAADIGKIVSVVSDGATGAEYGLANAPSSEIDYEIMYVKKSNNNTVTYQKNGQDSTWYDFGVDYDAFQDVGKYPVIAIKSDGATFPECFMYVEEGQIKPVRMSDVFSPKFTALTCDCSKIYSLNVVFVDGVPPACTGTLTVKTITTT